MSTEECHKIGYVCMVCHSIIMCSILGDHYPGGILQYQLLSTTNTLNRATYLHQHTSRVLPPFRWCVGCSRLKGIMPISLYIVLNYLSWYEGQTILLCDVCYMLYGICFVVYALWYMLCGICSMVYAQCVLSVCSVCAYCVLSVCSVCA